MTSPIVAPTTTAPIINAITFLFVHITLSFFCVPTHFKRGILPRSASLAWPRLGLPRGQVQPLRSSWLSSEDHTARQHDKCCASTAQFRGCSYQECCQAATTLSEIHIPSALTPESEELHL